MEVKDEQDGSAGELAAENGTENEFEEPGRKPDHRLRTGESRIRV